MRQGKHTEKWSREKRYYSLLNTVLLYQNLMNNLAIWAGFWYSNIAKKRMIGIETFIGCGRSNKQEENYCVVK